MYEYAYGYGYGYEYRTNTYEYCTLLMMGAGSKVRNFESKIACASAAPHRPFCAPPIKSRELPYASFVSDM